MKSPESQETFDDEFSTVGIITDKEWEALSEEMSEGIKQNSQEARDHRAMELLRDGKVSVVYHSIVGGFFAITGSRSFSRPDPADAIIAAAEAYPG